MTKRALLVMQDEFGSSEQLRVMFLNKSDGEIASYTDQINALPEVLLASYDPETGLRQSEGNTFHLITVTLNDCDAAALVKKLRAMFPDAGKYYVGGSAAAQLDIQRSVGEEMPLVMLIAVGIILLVLLLTSHAWAEPLVLLMILAVSILHQPAVRFLQPAGVPDARRRGGRGL